MAREHHAPRQTSSHVHGPACGHLAVQHEGHVDYLDHGRLEHSDKGRTEQHVIAVTDRNPDRCDPKHHASGHEAGHRHGADCGHEAVPHGGHIDYLVDGRLHHPHGDHCDDHGPLTVVSH
jgi:hypothetical protein